MTAPTAPARRGPNTNTAVATRGPDTLTVVREQLEQREGQITSLLGKSLAFDRFVTLALHAISSNTDLLRCSPISLVEAVREAASLQLELTGPLGDAWIVRYGDKAKLMPGYRGLMRLARRSGHIRSIDAHVVFEGDQFAVRLGSESVVEHVPTLGERGSYRGAYAFAKLDTGELVVEWMNVADIEQVRKTSRASDNGPWVAFWQEMARKTVLRRLMKRLPLGAEAERAIALDAEAEQDAQSQPTRRSPMLAKVHERLGIAAPQDASQGMEASSDATGDSGSDETETPVPAASSTAPENPSDVRDLVMDLDA